MERIDLWKGGERKTIGELVSELVDEVNEIITELNEIKEELK